MLQRKKSTLIVASCLLLFISGVKAQSFNDSLRLEAIAYYPTCPDTAFEGQNYGNVTVLIRNLRVNTVFTGQITVYVQSIDSSLGNMPVDTLIPFGGGTTYTIPAGTAINIFNSQNYPFTPAHYRTGSNVVVVWPVVSLGVNTFIDSLFKCVLFFPISGIETIDVNTLITTFPNPAEDYLTVKLYSQNFIEGVRIFDVSGRVVLSPLWDDSGKVKVDRLSSGMYVLEITTKNKQKLRKQFVRQ